MSFAPGTNNTINIQNIRPMTKEEALARTDNVFNFTITGKNTSDKDSYYGISLVDGSTENLPVGKTTPIDRENIDIL